MTDENVLKWLLEDDNPAVRYRTRTELLDIPKDSAEARSAHAGLVASDYMKSAMALFDVGKDFSDAHALSALAECGLTREDADIDRYADRLIANTNFRDGCGEGLLLRDLVALGYAGHPAVKRELPLILAEQQGDGGLPCVSKNPRIKKPGVPHKSCFQITTDYLLLAAEMRKRGVDCPQAGGIAGYFLGRDVIFRHDDPSRVVTKQMGMTFHPPVCTRIGLHMILCALSILGKGGDPACKRAWEMLDARRGADGRYIIDDSLSKPYIKTEKPGKPSKWVTFYALLAQKERDGYADK